MTDIGNLITGLFSPLGLLGGLLCILVLFYIDAIVFPTVPELFTMIFFGAAIRSGINPLLFGIAVLLTIMVSEVLGVLTLYYVVKKAKVPGRVQRIVKKYQGFLIIPDERMILVNRLAPVIPFLGAFVALCGWDLKKSIYYVMIGSIVKYGLILILSGLFFVYLDPDTAFIVTIMMVAVVILLSLVATYYRKRRMENAYRPA